MKKSVKKPVSVLLALMMAFGMYIALPFTVSAAEASETVGASSGTTGDCTWTLNDDGVLTISGNGAMGYNYSFSPWGTNIKGVVIENGVTSIGYRAFYGCTGLTSVSIPDSVTSIERYAFSGCNALTSVTIGNGVTSIGVDAFYGCTSLTGVYIYDIASWCEIIFHTSYEHDDFILNPYSNPLYYAHNLYVNNELVTDLLIPDGVTSIGDFTFYNYTSLTSVTIGNDLTSIGNYAFSGCTGLTSINIGNGVTSIGFYAFENCAALTGVYISDIAAWCGINFQYTRDYLGNAYHYSISNPLRYAHNLYLNNEIVTDLVIPDNVTSIGNGTFYGCTGLTSVSIGNSVTSIGVSAFYRCTGLESVTIGNGVTSIGEAAFCGCTGLNGVYINDIASWCKISFPATYNDGDSSRVPYSNPLYYTHNLYVNNSLVTDSLTIPDGVTNIGDYAFYNYTSLTSITIPDSVTSIGSDAFYGRSSDLIFICNPGSAAEQYARANNIMTNIPKLEYSILEDGTVEVIKYNDTRTDVVIPGTYQGRPITSLKNWLFMNNSTIKSVTIPDSVTHIGKGAFYSCVELKTVSMGNGVKDIGLSAFEKCIQLESVTLSDQLESIGDEAFYDCRRLRTLNIPATVTSIGEECFTNCRSLTSLVIPDGVQKLGSESSVGFGMFENCKSLEEITIPTSVCYIQSNAFDGCNSVTIRGKANSYAQSFANGNQILFKAIDIGLSVGDANSDAKINVCDVTAIQRHIAEIELLSDEQFAAADVNKDGVVTIDDATLIQMYLAEYDVVLG